MGPPKVAYKFKVFKVWKCKKKKNAKGIAS